MASKVRFGISNAYYALRTVTVNGNTTTISYDTPVAWKGAVSISLEPQGANEPFYADNIVYYQSIANQGYEGEFETAMIPDDVYEKLFGQTLDSSSKVLTEKNTDEAKEFALLFQINTDSGDNRYVVLYNCKATRASIGSQTIEDSKTPQTQTVTISATPNPDGKVQACTTDLTSSGVKTAWFSSVFGYGA